MEPSKFEEHSREQFEAREIQPSAQAWSTLESMLDAQAPQKKKRSFNWLAIAAVFIGFIVVGSFVFNSNRLQDSPSLVEKQAPSKQENELQINELNTQANEAIVENNIDTNTMLSTTEAALDKDAVMLPTNTTYVKKTPAIKSNKVKATVVLQEPKNAIAQQIPTIILKDNSAVLDSSSEISATEEVVANLNEGATKKDTRFISDVDALLKAAQEYIAMQEKPVVKKVDAMKLLGDVELEIETSLRDKFIYALGEGFDYVKSNVIDRNN
jgi:S-methylmethionine-dependent homocysteine/selenocysteine methylase